MRAVLFLENDYWKINAQNLYLENRSVCVSTSSWKVCEVSPVDPLFSCQTACSCSFSSGSGCGVKKFAKMSPARTDWWVSLPAGWWQGGRPVRRTGGRQGLASKPDRRCAKYVTDPPFHSHFPGPGYVLAACEAPRCSTLFIHPYEPSWCLTPFVN